MKVTEIVQPPSLAFQLEGMANKAMAEKKKEIIEDKQKEISESENNKIDILI